PIVKFPSISRDVALEVPRDVTSQSIIDLVWSLRPNYLVEIYPFDVYEGEHIDNDKKSIALHLIYQNKEDTLKDSDVKEAHEPVLERFERSEEHTSELQSRFDLVCRLLLEKKKNKTK